MSIEDGYKKRYSAGNTPWDLGKPDFNLIETVSGFPVPACNALDVGCGSGDNSIWLAEHGFNVIGTDVVDAALEKAKGKVAESGVECTFYQVDFMNSEVDGAPFGFIFDRGCFHSFKEDADRKRFAQNVAGHLTDDGLWLSILGNSDENRKGPGPPHRSALDIVSAVEPNFEILLLQTTRFGSNTPNPPRAWKCLMRKRPE